MKNLIIIFLFITNSYAQIKSGEVTYSVSKKTSFQTNISKNEFSFAKKKIDNKILNLNFVLKFNRNESIFSINKELEIDNEEFITKMAILSTRGNRIIYTDIVEEIILEKTALAEREYILKSSIKDLTWHMTQEKKNIGGYNCFKAIASKEMIAPIRNENNEEIKKIINYTVWYAPEINFPFGPYEFSGLPGLVLEFSNNNFVYYASKITFKDEDIIIEKPKGGKLINKTEYDKIGKSAFEKSNN